MARKRKPPGMKPFRAAYRDGVRDRYVIAELRGTMWWLRWWDADRMRYERKSLNTRDPDEAERKAREQAAALKERHDTAIGEHVTLGRLFALYLTHKSPKRSLGEQRQDKRRVDMFTRHFGSDHAAPGKTPVDVLADEDRWAEFIEQRSLGVINASGNPVKTEDHQSVEPRTVEGDLLWLVWVIYWGGRFRPDRRNKGTLLPPHFVQLKALKENVHNWPKVTKAKQPVASESRYQAVLKAASRVSMEIRWHGKREHQPAYLRDMLELVHETPLRLTALCNVRHNDYLPDHPDEFGNPLPYGAIRWRGKFDKQGREWVIPLSPLGQRVLERIRRSRPALGDMPMFPSRDNLSKPISRHTADAWLRKAEVLAGLPHLERGCWHPYRRKWSVERQGIRDQVAVAHAGGWASPRVMQMCYQHATMQGMLAAVLNAPDTPAAEEAQG